MRERLVEEQDFRPADHCPAQGHALQLPAGKFPGFALNRSAMPSTAAASATRRLISVLSRRRNFRPKARLP